MTAMHAHDLYHLTFYDVAVFLSLKKKDLVRLLKQNNIVDQDHIPYPEYSDRGYFNCVRTRHPTHPRTMILSVVVTESGFNFIQGLATTQLSLDHANTLHALKNHRKRW